MENNDHRSIWRFFDGSVSISVSMLLAVLVDSCALCARLPLLSLLASLTERENGQQAQQRQPGAQAATINQNRQQHTDADRN